MTAPAYLRLQQSGELRRRATAATCRLASCTLCPRRCGVDRAAGEMGVCGIARHAVVASRAPHFGEEDCLVGRAHTLFGASDGHGGSGTIFFSGCNLNCIFCQNWEISHDHEGLEVDAGDLAGMMLELQGLGCLNINLVTPSHVVPQVLEALVQAAASGLHLPIVYNTSGYDALSSLRLLDGVVDIYMPDFKYWNPEAAERYLSARDYPERTRAAIAEMHRQVGDLALDDTGTAIRGLLVRHLVMPGGDGESAAIFDWLAALSPATFLNVMAQYRPAGLARSRPRCFPDIGRPLSHAEWERALARAHAAGLARAGSS